MNNKFQFLLKFFKGNEKDEKEKKITSKFLIILLILGVLLMFSSNLFQAKKPEVPVLKSQTGQEQVKDVPTFGQKGSDNKSIIDKYEKEYEQQLKEALESITGVKDVSITVNLDSSEEKILDKNTVKRSQTTNETDKEGGTRKVEDESTDDKTVIIREGDKETPIVLKTEKPKVRGVLVVAKGVDNIQVKQMVREAVTRMLDVPSHRVSVLPKKN
ncbi:stage III sporulation protein AG [Bacillus sp. AFS018417]|uniref:stage III sporulation protein AG n=1 Tax=Bacillus TaxID=1386 RepID=UPI000BF45587|nr:MULTISPECIES: stage III sporulation protein AG [unclassified Bacillus (in: firmicutes)]MCP1125105.1 stage III sporulation protein AG [Bacillus sp. 3103sda1]PEZ07699.1 stage III sporulation protein AG [Bacillus sp. AFS018417]